MNAKIPATMDLTRTMLAVSIFSMAIDKVIRPLGRTVTMARQRHR